jgi:eukaryotic translation initiation factor 2C
MFFGADVTHNAGEGTSIAAVVGSLDLQFTHYGVQLGEQYNEKKNRKSKEIIKDLETMAFNLINSFGRRNKVLPSRIVFYRDGVDEGQFAKVLSQELNALKAACNKLKPGYSPLITFVIVVKRHNIRFFPINQNDKVSLRFCLFELAPLFHVLLRWANQKTYQLVPLLTQESLG